MIRTQSSVLAVLFVLSFVAPQLSKADDVPPNPNKPRLVTVEPTGVFVPEGFDSANNTQVVIHGAFTNTCFKMGPVEAKVSELSKEIQITNKAYYYPGCFCAEMMVPWFQVVNVGVIDAGRYMISAETKSGGTELLSPIGIAREKPGKKPGGDDYYYAPVSDATVVGENLPGKKSLILKGKFTNTCFSFKHQPKVLYQPGNVIVVLPIVEEATTNCQPAKIPFEVNVDLDKAPKGETLIHIRALSGASINKVVEFL